MTAPDVTVAVVGGGITGLAAAYACALSPVDVVLVEADERLGGKIRTDRIETVQVEAGADMFAAHDPAMVQFCRELNLDDELVAPQHFGGLVWRNGKLRRLPKRAVYGIPLSPFAAAAAGPIAALRASLDLLLPGRLEGADVAVADLVRGRMGARVLDRMVDPVLAGTRAGRVSEMSVAAALPQINAAARSKASLMRGLKRLPGGDALTEPRFVGLRSGMQTLVERARDRLGAHDLITGDPARNIESDGRRFRLTLASGTLIADAVILCTPAYAAGALVRGLDEHAGRDLEAIPYASAATVTLVYERGAVSFSEGSGALIPSSEDLTISACTWYSVKWPHATSVHDVVRCFVGRAGRAPALDLPDAELIRRAASDVAVILRSDAGPTSAHVVRWERSLPQYRVGHLVRLRRIDERLARYRGLGLAGAGYGGSGIPDCVRQGREAARSVIASLDGSVRP